MGRVDFIMEKLEQDPAFTVEGADPFEVFEEVVLFDVDDGLDLRETYAAYDMMVSTAFDRTFPAVEWAALTWFESTGMIRLGSRSAKAMHDSDHCIAARDLSDLRELVCWHVAVATMLLAEGA